MNFYSNYFFLILMTLISPKFKYKYWIPTISLCVDLLFGCDMAEYLYLELRLFARLQILIRPPDEATGTAFTPFTSPPTPPLRPTHFPSLLPPSSIPRPTSSPLPWTRTSTRSNISGISAFDKRRASIRQTEGVGGRGPATSPATQRKNKSTKRCRISPKY